MSEQPERHRILEGAKRENSEGHWTPGTEDKVRTLLCNDLKKAHGFAQSHGGGGLLKVGGRLAEGLNLARVGWDVERLREQGGGPAFDLKDLWRESQRRDLNDGRSTDASSFNNTSVAGSGGSGTHNSGLDFPPNEDSASFGAPPTGGSESQALTGRGSSYGNTSAASSAASSHSMHSDQSSVPLSFAPTGFSNGAPCHKLPGRTVFKSEKKVLFSRGC